MWHFYVKPSLKLQHVAQQGSEVQQGSGPRVQSSGSGVKEAQWSQGSRTLSDGLRSKTTSRQLKNFYRGRFVNIFFYFKNYSLNLERSYGGGFTLHNMLRPIQIIKPITRWNLFTNLGTNLSRKKDKFCKKRSRWLKTTASTNNKYWLLQVWCWLL